jgi:hypothetical protein
MVFDYFFLKFYNWVSKYDPEFSKLAASAFLGSLISLNLLVINGLLSKLGILPFIFDKVIGAISIVILTAFIFLRFDKNRIEDVKLRFSSEKLKSKKRVLNVIFASYVVLTVLALFFGALYRPGYLG